MFQYEYRSLHQHNDSSEPVMISSLSVSADIQNYTHVFRHSRCNHSSPGTHAASAVQLPFPFLSLSLSSRHHFHFLLLVRQTESTPLQLCLLPDLLLAPIDLANNHHQSRPCTSATITIHDRHTVQLELPWSNLVKTSSNYKTFTKLVATFVVAVLCGSFTSRDDHCAMDVYAPPNPDYV